MIELEEKRYSLEVECESKRVRVGGLEEELTNSRVEINILRRQVCI